ncbi:hypothetical protein [Croceicoccus pelagius]|uniref:UrcA family protein n=1 Tax=Croceicoccus pelagius TaxID=1703341 RepID=A0A916Y6D1_9SPHN|nr:hypothetical protein [Croceicoccus pelagius]GGD31965.1 hypothetical protein GCM10010989_02520 [Croceicoccus pelagius]
MIYSKMRGTPYLAALVLGLVTAPVLPVAAQESRDPRAIRQRNALDCTFRLTNDYIKDVILMQDTTFSPEACATACARFAEQSVVSMRDAVYVLRYTCEYRGQLVANVDLKVT